LVFNEQFTLENYSLHAKKYRTTVIRQNRQLIFSRKRTVFANENAPSANQPQNRAKKPANQKGRMF